MERLQLAEWHLCAGDVLHWLGTWCWLEDPKAKDVEWRALPLVLWPEQVRLVEFLLAGIDEQRDRNVNKAREIGVSWLCSLVCLHRWSFERGFKAKFGSRKQSYVDDRTSDSLFGKLRFAMDRLPDFLLPVVFRVGHEKARGAFDSTLRLMNPEMGSEIIGESSNPNFGRGGRRAVILIDEDAHVDTSIQDSMHVALETVAASKWRVSTPNGRGNRFHADYAVAKEMHNSGDDAAWSNWLELDWHTNPTRDEQWHDSLLKEHGGKLTWDEREQEHNCSFAGVSGIRIFKVDASAVGYVDADLPPLARETFYHVCAADFGSGPSLTCFYWLLLNWDLGDGELPMVWVDCELVRQRTSAYEVAHDVVELGKQYGGYSWYTGDPTGKNTESDQESWESRLRQGGVPISLLPDVYNTADYTTHVLREAQLMMDSGLLKIHATRCPFLLETVETWQWDTPRGVPIDLVNRDTIRPKKDAWSHAGDAAFRYGLGAGLRVDYRAARAVQRQLDEPEVRRRNLRGRVDDGTSNVSSLEASVELVYDVALNEVRDW